MQPDWLVMKLGGTSVSHRIYWDNAVARIRKALDAGQRVIVVHSALAGVTNLLETIADGNSEEKCGQVQVEIASRHFSMADELGVTDTAALKYRLRELNALAESVSPVSPEKRARLLAMGELLLTCLVLPFMEAQSLPVEVVDARELLKVREQEHLHSSRHYLAAICDHAPYKALAKRLRQSMPVVLTQGFIACDAAGKTVLLGRGGSDTSAACLAAKLGASELEIWTDVPGLFTADPHQLPTARLLKQLAYDEALEIAATGARVLHPYCIRPLRDAGIPLTIRYAPQPELPGTRVEAFTEDLEGRLKAVCLRRDITTITIDTADMWQQAGFLADTFACFKRHHISVDMISTSETSITVTLDPAANPLGAERIDALCTDLGTLGDVQLMRGCAAVSLVGRRIRANLHRIAPLLEVFSDRRVHLVCQASNDLNITFVVDEHEASRLVAELHALLVGSTVEDDTFGPTWEELCVPPVPGTQTLPWWQRRQSRLLDLAVENGPCYVYDIETVRTRAVSLRRLSSPSRIFYAVKANCHTDILRALYDCGLGFECVSPGELAHVLTLFPEISRRQILFTPNFAPRDDYAIALEAGVRTTLDNLYPLRAWPDLFSGHDILLRVDLGVGAGHHRHVRTGGSSKFGIPLESLDEARHLATAQGIRIVGLHTHAGSGIKDAAHWRETGSRLAQAAHAFPDIEIVDLGGGLGVSAHPADSSLDLAALDTALSAVTATLPGIELWLEPGRFLVSEAGVLLARVTQLKAKGEVRFLGVDTGMNSLLRPALYGAYHRIVNLSRLEEPAAGTYTVVGPICETGDTLGTARRLPETMEHDVLLIANAGAYGHVMSSTYNLRPPAREVALTPEFESSRSYTHTG
jgi:diaminopimelate decarboxylase/aspartate kinase